MNDKDKEAFEKWALEYISTRIGYFKMIGTDDLTQEIWQAACEYKQKEIDELKTKLSVCKNDYWFMINLIERYSTDKEQALKDCLDRMKFRKGLFNILGGME